MEQNFIIICGVIILPVCFAIFLIRRVSVRPVMQIIRAAGFLYNREKNIFHARINAIQRRFGYCKAYDALSPAFGMAIDCEPIYFEYRGRQWLIELWKGQYGITCGGEVGVYKAPFFCLAKSPEQILYKKIRRSEFMKIGMQIFSPQGELITNKGRHWWMTGFRLGECIAPNELSMEVTIEFPDINMRGAFLQALREKGYRGSRMAVAGKTVFIRFLDPLSKQPQGNIENVMQANRTLCKIWKKAVMDETNMEACLEKIRESDPELFRHATALARPKPMYRVGRRHMRGKL